MFIENKNNKTSTRGCSKAEAYGFFTNDELTTRKCLLLDIYLVGFTTFNPKPENLYEFNEIKVPWVRFELRPDLRYSLIGKNIWEKWRKNVNIPEYDHVGYQNGNFSNMFIKTYRLSGFRIALWSECFNFIEPIVPQIWVGLNDKLNPEICCLGRDFLQKGLLVWDKNASYFYPLTQKYFEWWAPNNFNQPIKSDI